MDENNPALCRDPESYSLRKDIPKIDFQGFKVSSSVLSALAENCSSSSKRCNSETLKPLSSAYLDAVFRVRATIATHTFDAPARRSTLAHSATVVPVV